MKKFLVLLLVLTLFLLCGCTSGTKSSGNSSSQTDQTSNSTSLKSVLLKQKMATTPTCEWPVLNHLDAAKLEKLDNLCNCFSFGHFRFLGAITQCNHRNDGFILAD